MIKVIVLVFLIILINSCADVQQSLNPKDYYPHDMEVTVNKIKYNGIGTLPRSGVYEFKIKSPGKLDLLMYTNCHKSVYSEEAWSDSWFSSKYEASFSFKIDDELEKHSCPILISGYEKVLGRHSTAWLDFQDDKNTMPAKMLCNGESLNLIGVGACQSRAELIQKLNFPTEMLVETKMNCPKLEDNKKEYLISLGRGYCVYNFLAADKNDDRKFRLTTYGWDEPILRKE